MRFEIEKQVNELTKQVWGFSEMGVKLYLGDYVLLKREDTRKRKYRVIEKYDRLDSRHNTITEDQVPFGDELKKQAYDEFIKNVEVLKWSERKY
jgi:hypothetical protein